MFLAILSTARASQSLLLFLPRSSLVCVVLPWHISCCKEWCVCGVALSVFSSSRSLLCLLPLFKVVVKAKRFLVKAVVSSMKFGYGWPYLRWYVHLGRQLHLRLGTWCLSSFPLRQPHLLVRCFIFLFLEGVYGAAAALMNVATLGGSVTASFMLLSMFFEGSGAAMVRESVAVTAAAFMLLCAATAAAGTFGTVVVCALPNELTDGGFTKMSVFVALTVFAGVFTSVGFYFHFAGWQPAFEVSQQQAAAAGVTMPQRQRLHHGWTWVTSLRRQASIRLWDRTKLKVKVVPKHKSSKSLSRTWLERRWWCGVSTGWTRCLWSSVKLSCSLVFLALCSI